MPPPTNLATSLGGSRRSLTSLITGPTRRLTETLAYSRRRHQHRAHASHYSRQETQLT